MTLIPLFKLLRQVDFLSGHLHSTGRFPVAVSCRDWYLDSIIIAKQLGSEALLAARDGSVKAAP